jgi:hypothetical protein
MQRIVFVCTQLVAFSLRRSAGSLGIVVTTREYDDAGCMRAVLRPRRTVTAGSLPPLAIG